MAAALDEANLDNYPALYQQFRWHVPKVFNIAEVCCARWASDKARIAVHYEDESGHTSTLSYAAMQIQANRMSNVLRNLGVRRGERIAIILPQRPETAIAHMACFQLGAVAVPLSAAFGPDALACRLHHSDAVVAIVDETAMVNLTEARTRCPSLLHVIAVDCDGPVTLDWFAEIAAANGGFQPVKTLATDPAILIYTSGTTAAAKGVLLPHAAIIGNLTGFVASQNWFPKEGDVFWSPTDWARTEGLMGALLPTLYFGKPIVAYRDHFCGHFSAEAAFSLLQKYGVTNTSLPPACLQAMMKAEPTPYDKYALKLRSIMSTGATVSDDIAGWSYSALGIAINTMFGLTELHFIVGNSEQWPAKSGSLGRPYPGHRVAVIDDNGHAVKTGETGELALNRTDIHGFPDPIFFIEYWKNTEATAGKFHGDWCRTGDLAHMDADGYLWYHGRREDIFKTSDYRIEPIAIENCLLKHRAVAHAAIVPRPDMAGENIVKAFIVPTLATKRSRAADDKLIAELQSHVRDKLSPYACPTEVEFIDELPMTLNGKLQRRVLRQLEEERTQHLTNN
jgi:acetyl-CoA synthetase